jgi:putative oxidoreductase
MKKLLSTDYTDSLFNIGIFLLRVTLGILMCIHHGIPKIYHFSEWQNTFFNFMNLGSRWSLVLSILAEAFASAFLVLGLFSRIAAILLLIDLGVAIFVYQIHQPIVRYEDALLFFAGFLLILLVGPGKISVDSFAGK